MENDSTDSIPPELQVWVDMEFTLEGRNSPADHQKIESALADVHGIGSLNFLENRIAIRYDPERVTRARLCALIQQAGYRMSGVESASSDPAENHGGERPRTPDEAE